MRIASDWRKRLRRASRQREKIFAPSLLRVLWNESQSGAPRVRHQPFFSLLLYGMPSCLHALGGFFGVASRWDDDLPLQQTRICIARRRRTTRPRIRSKMMVISAGRHEQRPRITPHDFVEAKRVMIERLGFGNLIDVEMNVTKYGSRRHSSPRLAARGFHQILDIQMIGRHVQLALVVAPGPARSVGVDFDSQSIGISEINCLADEVIRHSGVGADLAEMRHESAERSAIGQQDGEMIQAEQAATRNRTRGAELAQMNDLSIFGMRPQAHPIATTPYHAHAEHLLVERDRPLQISDLQPDSTKSRRFRKSISLRPNATLCIGTHHLLCHCPLFSPLPSRIPHPASRLRLDTLSLISGP